MTCQFTKAIDFQVCVTAYCFPAISAINSSAPSWNSTSVLCPIHAPRRRTGSRMVFMGSRSTIGSFPVSAPISVSLANIPREGGRHAAVESHPRVALSKFSGARHRIPDRRVRPRGRIVERAQCQVKAVQLLIGVNRQIYFACPEVPNLGERWRALLHREAVHLLALSLLDRRNAAPCFSPLVWSCGCEGSA